MWDWLLVTDSKYIAICNYCRPLAVDLHLYEGTYYTLSYQSLLLVQCHHCIPMSPFLQMWLPIRWLQLVLGLDKTNSYHSTHHHLKGHPSNPRDTLEPKLQVDSHHYRMKCPFLLLSILYWKYQQLSLDSWRCHKYRLVLVNQHRHQQHL